MASVLRPLALAAAVLVISVGAGCGATYDGRGDVSCEKVPREDVAAADRLPKSLDPPGSTPVRADIRAQGAVGVIALHEGALKKVIEQYRRTAESQGWQSVGQDNEVREWDLLMRSDIGLAYVRVTPSACEGIAASEVVYLKPGAPAGPAPSPTTRG
jgi:hypothetical protein